MLPIEVEARLATDFAFLAANAEGVGSVAAACIEEDAQNNILKLRLAANEGVREDVRHGLLDIWAAARPMPRGQ